MSDKELKQVLQEIKDYCHKRDEWCYACKFHSHDGCLINNIPVKWNVDKIGTDTDKWHKLYRWLVDMRVAIVPDARKGLREYTIDTARVELLVNIMAYMNQLEEDDDET